MIPIGIIRISTRNLGIKDEKINRFAQSFTGKAGTGPDSAKSQQRTVTMRTSFLPEQKVCI